MPIVTEPLERIREELYTAERQLTEMEWAISAGEHFQKAEQLMRTLQAQGQEIPPDVLSYRGQVRGIIYNQERLEELFRYAKSIATSSYPEHLVSPHINASGVIGLSNLEEIEAYARDGGLGFNFPREEYRMIMEYAILKGMSNLLDGAKHEKRRGAHESAQRYSERAREIKVVAERNSIQLPEGIRLDFQRTEDMVSTVSFPTRVKGIFRKVLPVMA